MSLKSHKVDEIAIRRCDTRPLDHLLGYRSGGRVSRSWREPYRTPEDPTFNGRPSPASVARAYLQEVGRLNPEGRDLWIYTFQDDAYEQDADRAGVPRDRERDPVIAFLVERYARMLEALLSDSTTIEEQVTAVLQSGASCARALRYLRHKRAEPPRYTRPLLMVVA